MLRRKLAVLMAAVLMTVMMLAVAGPASAQEGSQCRGFGEVAQTSPLAAPTLVFFVITFGGPQAFGEICSPD